MDIGDRKTTLNIDYVMGLDLFQSLVSIKYIYMNKIYVPDDQLSVDSLHTHIRH